VSVKTAFTVAVTVLAVVGTAWFLLRTTRALLVTAASLLIAVALNRVVQWLQAHRVPRGVGIALVMLAVVGAVVGLGFLIVPPVIDQASALVAEWPRIVAAIQRSSLYRIAAQHADLQSVLERAERAAPQALGAAVAVVRGSATALVAFVTVLFVTLFMLTSGRPLVWALLAQARPERRARYADVLVKIYHALGGYVAGHVFIVGVQACATSAFLAIVGVPFFLPLGITSAIASLIPFAGVTVMGIVISTIAWASNGLWTGMASAIYYVAYQQLESHLLYPLVYRRAVEVNPLLTVLGVLFMGELGGIAGAILAVPLVAAGHIVVRELLAERRARLGIPTVPPTPAVLTGDGPRDRSAAR
jgi:predicted PurR-regulated permease PerM